MTRFRTPVYSFLFITAFAAIASCSKDKVAGTTEQKVTLTGKIANANVMNMTGCNSYLSNVGNNLYLVTPSGTIQIPITMFDLSSATVVDNQICLTKSPTPTTEPEKTKDSTWQKVAAAINAGLSVANQQEPGPCPSHPPISGSALVSYFAGNTYDNMQATCYAFNNVTNYALNFQFDRPQGLAMYLESLVGKFFVRYSPEEAYDAFYAAGMGKVVFASYLKVPSEDDYDPTEYSRVAMLVPGFENQSYTWFWQGYMGVPAVLYNNGTFFDNYSGPYTTYYVYSPELCN